MIKKVNIKYIHFDCLQIYKKVHFIFSEGNVKAPGLHAVNQQKRVIPIFFENTLLCLKNTFPGVSNQSGSFPAHGFLFQ